MKMNILDAGQRGRRAGYDVLYGLVKEPGIFFLGKERVVVSQDLS